MQRIFMSSHTADEWKQVFARMEGYAQGSQPQRPRLLPPGGRTNRDILDPKAAQATADYFASISLNGPDAQEFEIKTEARPKDRSTKAIITFTQGGQLRAIDDTGTLELFVVPFDELKTAGRFLPAHRSITICNDQEFGRNGYAVAEDLLQHRLFQFY